ncbi:Hypothetical predicted protein [Mytilus galloprovincialis]|uniref:Reverse transcriptase RNase H-like domain-containing protein n=1 Tax=Mytilus galloprovincialis TaxID=29158 RepID=A0A8B6C3N4_MYTGA|nr:Hypothetical predicted protein [Mytilus galloprovincialis]
MGFGEYVVSISDTDVMGSWNSVESLKSSTQRELKAAYRVLLSLLVTLQGETIKWYTHHQNMVYIIMQGSRMGDLQLITIKIANVCVNAFDQDWKSKVNWIVPPTSLVSKCIQKMKQKISIGTLIVPYWRSAPFWPILNVGIDGSQKFASCVGDSRFLSSSVVMRGRGRNGLFGKTDTNFTLLALKIRV